MSSERSSSDVRYAVVVNDERQYSIWPADRQRPTGWSDEGHTGTEEECLAYIDETWTDMRPLSLQRETAREPGEGP